eukprot:CAMPEP_0204840996 /NCGR_PEP_ID=MMETSP1346-20131115/40002_1 /ASSEMBLY_ACC=CAM_ASM_000771 /TAXON_ID=215587 /ORGANISM="Aplanochytrium stocchinoi, Strain GSBS06" /LENGTH=77 /DNA_ID=CAMNT_0051978797 /DNA_START=134 /DNA_END=364 /DNA_ORIENTATION=-
MGDAYPSQSQTPGGDEIENGSLGGNEMADIFSDIRNLDVQIKEGVNVEAKWKDMVNFSNNCYENKVSVFVKVSEKKR